MHAVYVRCILQGGAPELRNVSFTLRNVIFTLRNVSFTGRGARVCVCVMRETFITVGVQRVQPSQEHVSPPPHPM